MERRFLGLTIKNLGVYALRPYQRFPFLEQGWIGSSRATFIGWTTVHCLPRGFFLKVHATSPTVSDFEGVGYGVLHEVLLTSTFRSFSQGTIEHRTHRPHRPHKLKKHAKGIPSPRYEVRLDGGHAQYTWTQKGNSIMEPFTGGIYDGSYFVEDCSFLQQILKWNKRHRQVQVAISVTLLTDN